VAQALPPELDLYFNLGLVPIPLKPQSKQHLVKWGDGWNPTPDALGYWLAKPRINWGVRCVQNLAVIDCAARAAFPFVAICNSPLTNFTNASRFPSVRTLF